MSDRPAEEQAVAQPSVGDKVNAIIAAAESAAQEITDKARLEAHNILRMAEQQASERITELTREAAQAKTEADQYARDMTEAADSYGTQHRRTVEEEARRLLADAEAKAKEQLETAQAKANELERNGRPAPRDAPAGDEDARGAKAARPREPPRPGRADPGRPSRAISGDAAGRVTRGRAGRRAPLTPAIRKSPSAEAPFGTCLPKRGVAGGETTAAAG